MTNAWATLGLSGLWANFFGNMIVGAVRPVRFWRLVGCVIVANFTHYETLFEKTFASHECDVFGCTDCWVIDGHLKNRRFICATKHINFVKVEGFPNGGFFEGCKKNQHPRSCFARTVSSTRWRAALSVVS